MVVDQFGMYSYARYGLSSVGYRWAMESNRARFAQWEKDHQAKKCETWLRLRTSGDLAVVLSYGLLFPLLGLLALAGIAADVLQIMWMVHQLRVQNNRPFRLSRCRFRCRWQVS